MDKKQTELEMKLKDFKRFVSTLIILSCYLYMGAVINLYFRPSDHGMVFVYLTIVTVLATMGFLYKYNKIKMTIEKNEQV